MSRQRLSTEPPIHSAPSAEPPSFFASNTYHQITHTSQEQPYPPRPRVTSYPPPQRPTWSSQRPSGWSDIPTSRTLTDSHDFWSSSAAQTQTGNTAWQDADSFPTPTSASSVQTRTFGWQSLHPTETSHDSWKHPHSESFVISNMAAPPRPVRLSGPASALAPKHSATLSPVTVDASPTAETKSQSGGRESSLRLPRWILRGSCACSFVQYELSVSKDELPLQACYCHCAACRNLSGSNYVAFTSVPSDRLRWFSGVWDWKQGRGIDITKRVSHVRDQFEFGKAPGFRVVHAGKDQHASRNQSNNEASEPAAVGIDSTTSHVLEADQHPLPPAASSKQDDFGKEPAIRLWGSSRKAVRGSCARCGTNCFISYHSDVKTTDITLGTLWTTEDKGAVLVKPVMHIMLREKALWENIPDDGLQRYEGLPGEGEEQRSEKNGPQTVTLRSRRSQGQRLASVRHLIKCMMVY